MAATDRDVLVHAIGQQLAADPALAGDWATYALVVVYDGDTRRLSGFRYRDGAAPQAATPRSPAFESQLDSLREATRVDGTDPWRACVIRIVRASGRITLEFDYDTPEQWQVTPTTLDAVAERARPR